MSWALCYIAQYPVWQERLREEWLSAKAGAHELESEQLDGLRYMDAFTREVLRLEPSIATTYREAAVDDVLPLSKPIRSRDGQWRDSIPVKRGQGFFISFAAFNRSHELFGKDADHFKPERWLEGTPDRLKRESVGVWSSIPSFSLGRRYCIGCGLSLRHQHGTDMLPHSYKFALLEMKMLVPLASWWRRS